MPEDGLVPIFVTALLSSSFAGGLMTLLAKRVSSPESRNELAKLGNEFAQQLLKDAKEEREELRLSIRELENLASENKDTIYRLTNLLKEKTERITDLEKRHHNMANKLRQGDAITLQDIFGGIAPEGLALTETHIRGEDYV